MKTQSDSFKLRQMITSYWVTQLIYAAAKLGIADLLEKGPKHCAELADKTNTKPKLLYRLLRGLASHGIFSEGPKEIFQLTPLASLLQTSHPGSLKDIAIFYGEEPYEMFGKLLHTLKTGDVAFEHVYGTSFFNYLSQHSEKSETFNMAMANISVEQAKAIVKSYDFSNIKTLVDVGGYFKKQSFHEGCTLRPTSCHRRGKDPFGKRKFARSLPTSWGRFF